MTHRAALIPALTVALSACGPSVDVQSTEGTILLSVRKGPCFVGCRLRVRARDDQICQGHATGISEGYPLNGLIFCDGKEQQTLTAAALRNGQPVQGLLDDTPVTVTLKQ